MFRSEVWGYRSIDNLHENSHLCRRTLFTWSKWYAQIYSWITSWWFAISFSLFICLSTWSVSLAADPFPARFSCAACSRLLTDMEIFAEGEISNGVSYQYRCKWRWPKWRRARDGWGTIKQNHTDHEIWWGGGEAWIWNAQTNLVALMSSKNQSVRKMMASSGRT